MANETVDRKAEAIRVPAKILDGLEAVRRSGLVNMVDRNGVAEVALALGHPAVADWVLAEPGQYARGVFRGFVAEE